VTDRAAHIAAFLDAAGWGAATRVPLSGDASFRHYERLVGGPRPALLMDAPPPEEDVRAYGVVARHLVGLGYSAPQIYAEDGRAGLLVIEDFGDETYTRRLAAGHGEEDLYALAVDLLIDLHCRGDALGADPARPIVPPYDDDALLTEAALLTDWYLPAMTGRPTEATVRESYLALWRGLFPAVRALPRSLVLRDYHVDNLMWLADRSGTARCGLLDFQDARAGPVVYDLVSLLEDARRDIDPALAAAMRRRYLDAFPDIDRDAFDAACAILGAQRNCKIIGIFTRLCRRDDKPGYLVHIPRVWHLLEGDLDHPVLAPLARWLEAHAAARGVPPVAQLAEGGGS